MIKHTAWTLILVTMIIFLSSCTILVEHIDKNTHFSEQVSSIESAIRSESWEQANESLSAAKKAWKRLKPVIQIDIDHDYIHVIEDNIAELKAYIDTKQKPDALAKVLLIQETWEDIGGF